MPLPHVARRQRKPLAYSFKKISLLLNRKKMSKKSFETLAVHAGEDLTKITARFPFRYILLRFSPFRMPTKARRFIIIKKKVIFTDVWEIRRKPRWKAQLPNLKTANPLTQSHQEWQRFRQQFYQM